MLYTVQENKKMNEKEKINISNVSKFSGKKDYAKAKEIMKEKI